MIIKEASERAMKCLAINIACFCLTCTDFSLAKLIKTTWLVEFIFMQMVVLAIYWLKATQYANQITNEKNSREKLVV